MKGYQWIILGLMNLFVIFVVVVLAISATYAYMLPMTQPEVQHEVQIVTIEVPKIVEKQVVVTKEILVTPIPTEIQLLPPVIQTTPTPIILPTKESCTNLAVIEMQPKDYVQSSALRVHTGYIGNTRIKNVGTCPWIGYHLKSIAGDALDVEVPTTYPGEVAEFTIARGTIDFPLHYMLVLHDELGQAFPFYYGGTVDGCMAWTIEMFKFNTFNQKIWSGFTSRLSCVAGG